jgi:hypothetical protein
MKQRDTWICFHPENESHGMLARDSEGRVLQEGLPSPKVSVSGGATFTTLSAKVTDPSAKLEYRWDEMTKTVLKMRPAAHSDQVIRRRLLTKLAQAIVWVLRAYRWNDMIRATAQSASTNRLEDLNVKASCNSSFGMAYSCRRVSVTLSLNSRRPTRNFSRT